MFPEFQLVPLPSRLIAEASVRLPVQGRTVEMPMRELISDMNRTWLNYLVNEAAR